MIDVLQALYPFKEHRLYPQACARVLAEKRACGAAAAIARADRIAEAMADNALEKRLK